MHRLPDGGGGSDPEPYSAPEPKPRAPLPESSPIAALASAGGHAVVLYTGTRISVEPSMMSPLKPPAQSSRITLTRVPVVFSPMISTS